MLTRRLAAQVVWIVALAGCEGGTGPGPIPDYFPLAAGNRWTYAPEDPWFGAPFEWRVTGRQGDTVRIARPEGGSHPGPVTLLADGLDVDLLLEDGAVVPFYRFDVGASWSHRDPWECDDGATLTAVREPDPVVVPAGTFSGTLRVERRTTASCTDAGTMIEWWAPDVGLVRWEELNYYAGGPLVFELVDYSVN